MAGTMAERIEHASIAMDDLKPNYGPMLALVRELIGVVPKCDQYLEIWSPGFRTYNLIVPNLLNLPSSLMGRGAPKDAVGLGMYVSSRAAGCGYCSAHTCSFALRRGSTAEAVTGEQRSAPEQAVADLAEAIGAVPDAVTGALVAAVRKHYSEEDTEWIALGMVMMGFLNKFMDAMGIELEVESLNDVTALIEPTGWSSGQHNWHDPEVDTDSALPSKDSLGTYFRVMRHGPFAARIESRWLDGVPKKASDARTQLATETGYDEPLLEASSFPRVSRALAGVLRENLNESTTALGLDEKAVVAARFADFLGSEHLKERAAGLLDARGIGPDDKTTDGPRWAAIAALTDAFAPSPAAVDDATADQAEAALSPAEIVELAVWLSVLQAWHRWDLFVRHR